MDNTCEDFLAFQDALKKTRKIDDNIVYLLNTTIPTDSFATKSSNATNQCKDLYDQLQNSYKQREGSIKRCISVVSTSVQRLKDERQKNSEEMDMDALKRLRKEQTKLRLMQNELNVEEVVRDRTLKIFYERCRQFYKPSDLNV